MKSNLNLNVSTFFHTIRSVTLVNNVSSLQLHFHKILRRIEIV